MRRDLLRGTITGATLIIAGFLNPAYANLLTNGSFEDTTNFVPDANDTMSLPVGSTAMPGWTVVGGSLAWIGPTNPFGLSASNGSYFLDLTDYRDAPPFGGVTQTLSTVAGGLYRLTFDLGSSSRYGIPDSITASAGATSQTFVSTLTGTNNWQSETLDFLASGSATTIQLVGFAGQQYIGLDNVSVDLLRAPVGVPEPSSLAVIGVALAGLGLIRRRRKGHQSQSGVGRSPALVGIE
jgi:hypothetical protein